MSVGVRVGPSGNTDSIAVLTCPTSVYMATGWESRPFLSHDPGFGKAPGAIPIYVCICLSLPINAYMVIGWESQLFSKNDPRAMSFGAEWVQKATKTAWLY